LNPARLEYLSTDLLREEPILGNYMSAGVRFTAFSGL